MSIILKVIAGPHPKGLKFTFDKHDTFLVGRSKHAHFQLPAKDKYFSRMHFMLEVNPPQCRLIDMGSHNGTYVNGEKILTADLKDGDEIRAGHTVLRVKVVSDVPIMPSLEHQEEIATGFLPEIPGYQLSRELGRGAMGVTYLAQRGSEPDPYAVKVVRPSFRGSPGQIAEFLQAARFLTQLEHPHIIRLREIGVCPSGFYFASDYVAGQNVLELLQREGGPMSLERTNRLVNQILLALQHAHAQHLVHREIKPSNIIITEKAGKEYVHLGDYGLARVYQSTPFSGLSLTSALLNNVHFVPPEVLFSYQDINPLADQYSTAAVIYVLLTGVQVLKLPKKPQTDLSSVLRHLFVPIRERRTEVPQDLADVLHRALSRTPQKRFGSIEKFHHAFSRAMQGN